MRDSSSSSLLIDNNTMVKTEPIRCRRCSNAESLPSSLPISLRKISSINRSVASIDQGSRGESLLELEAIATIQELSFGVQSICVSEILPRTCDLIFVNVTTLEGQSFCLELTHKGWRIASLRCDCMMGDFTRLELFTKYYDSLHSLMHSISAEYRSLYNEKLAAGQLTFESDDHADNIALRNYISSRSRAVSLDSC